MPLQFLKAKLDKLEAELQLEREFRKKVEDDLQSLRLTKQVDDEMRRISSHPGTPTARY